MSTAKQKTNDSSINGIPVKIATKEKTALTIYFATFRKCLKLKKLTKDIFKLQTEQEKLDKLERLHMIELSGCQGKDLKDSIVKVEELSKQLDEIREKQYNSTERLTDIYDSFVLTGLMGAGYSNEKAKEISEYLPMDRMPELLQASRIGAMRLVDFFTESQPKT